MQESVPLYVVPMMDLSNPGVRGRIDIVYTAKRMAVDATVTGIVEDGHVVTDPIVVKQIMTDNLAAAASDPSVPVLMPLVHTICSVRRDHEPIASFETTYAYPCFRLKRGVPARLTVTNRTGF